MVYEPQEKFTEKKAVRNRKVPNITPGRAALVELMRRYLAGHLDPFITLLEVHKLMYFMQVGGRTVEAQVQKSSKRSLC